MFGQKIKFGNTIISVKEGIKTSMISSEKPIFLRGALGSSSIIWDWYGLETLHQCDKQVKTKKFGG